MTNTVPYPARWAALAVVLVGECIDLIDSTVVNVAAPKIAGDFHASSTALQWVVGGYPLAVAVGLILGGRLGDLIGRRRMFLIGLTGFVVSSAVCGLAPGIGVLVTARLVQGGFAAMMLPQGLGIMREVFDEQEQQKAFALFGPVIGLSAILGPLLGGLLTGVNWRWCFLINVPIGLAGLIYGLKVLPPSKPQKTVRLDVTGTVLVGLFSILLVYPLIEGREYGWPWWTWASIAGGLIALMAAGFQQRARERAGRDPLVITSIFSSPGYSAGLGYMSLFFAGVSGTLLVTTLFLQLGQNFSPVRAALTIVPLTVGLTVGAVLSGALLGPKFGRVTLQGGTAVAIAGWIVVLFALAGNGRVGALSLLPGLALAGLGFGLVVAPLFDIVLAQVTERETGSASGVLNALQQLAGSVGVAVIGSVFFDAIGPGNFHHALRLAIIVQIVMLVAALLITPLLPRRARAEAVPAASTA